MKFTGFSENKECMFLFKTQSVCIVIYCLFLKALENRNGKLLSFFWSSHLRCFLILKNKFRKIHSKTPVPEQNSEQNNCVRVSFLINLHAFALQLKRKLRHRCFLMNSAKFLGTSSFRSPPDNYFWILQMKIKLLKMKFLIDCFTFPEVSYTYYTAQ